MMPAAGKYELKEITRTEFVSIMLQSFEKGDLVNRIGYPQNLNLIKQWTGIRLSPSRDKTEISSGDQMLCMTLKYRANRPKGAEVDASDFQFWIAKYNE